MAETTDLTTVFDTCRGGRHDECQGTFTIPIQGDSDFFSSKCTCSCHDNAKLSEPAENMTEVDFVSVKNKDSMYEIANEVFDLFGMDANLMVACMYVAYNALEPDNNNSFPFWKAYEEAKAIVLEKTAGVMNLCTGDVDNTGNCKVCSGYPAIVFIDTNSDLEIHLLAEKDELYGIVD